MSSIRIEGAIIGVGLLILQRIPSASAARTQEPGNVIVQPIMKALLVPESVLADHYDEALQEFKDDVKSKLGHDFEPPHGFRQAVLDHLRRYLEDKGLLK